MSLANPYKRASIQTASRERLLLMLYDGLIRFVLQAKEAIAERNVQSANRFLQRAQDIVMELRTTLDRDAAPELCNSLQELYTYLYGKLVDANRLKDCAHLDEILPMIQELRDAFAEAERLLTKERANGHAVID